MFTTIAYVKLLRLMRRGIFFLLIFLASGGMFWFGWRWYLSQKKPLPGALQVTSTPQVDVFLDEKLLGKTPFYDEQIAPGEYNLRLAVEDESTSSSWQAKIKIAPRVLTAVDRNLDSNDSKSFGAVLTMEQLNNKKSTEISLFSNPDGAVVKLDSLDKGSTPLIIRGVSAGDHQLLFLYPGFQDLPLRITVNPGYNLLARVKLATLESPPATTSGAKVKIGETPTGWLRVRVEPSLTSSETARVSPGETYPLLEEQEGWLKIQYEDGKEGWVSSQYAQKE